MEAYCICVDYEIDIERLYAASEVGELKVHHLINKLHRPSLWRKVTMIGLDVYEMRYNNVFMVLLYMLYLAGYRREKHDKHVWTLIIVASVTHFAWCIVRLLYLCELVDVAYYSAGLLFLMKFNSAAAAHTLYMFSSNLFEACFSLGHLTYAHPMALQPLLKFSFMHQMKPIGSLLQRYFPTNVLGAFAAYNCRQKLFMIANLGLFAISQPDKALLTIFWFVLSNPTTWRLVKMLIRNWVEHLFGRYTVHFVQFVYRSTMLDGLYRSRLTVPICMCFIWLTGMRFCLYLIAYSVALLPALLVNYVLGKILDWLFDAHSQAILLCLRSIVVALVVVYNAEDLHLNRKPKGIFSEISFKLLSYRPIRNFTVTMNLVNGRVWRETAQ